MRVARNERGKLCFAPEEWWTAKQIASHFSRPAATQHQQKAPGELLVQEAEAISEEDLQAWKTERQLQELQTAVYQGVDLWHPIEYNGHDICSLAKRNMLKSRFKVAQLKEICFLFGIEIEGPAGRKDSYVKPLEDVLQTCSCFKEWLDDSDSKPDNWKKVLGMSKRKQNKTKIGDNTAKTNFCLICCVRFHQQHI